MTNAERLYGWNRWYDELPDGWRFQVVFWAIIAVSAVNMLLTIAVRFPFGLLTLLAILFVAGVRFPYSAGWIVPGHAHAGGPPADWRLQGPSAGWLADVNRRYEAMPEQRRFWVIPVILVAAGAINMWLTLEAGFPFGLLFLLAILALVVIRAPYAAGALSPAENMAFSPAGNSGIQHVPAEAIQRRPYESRPGPEPVATDDIDAPSEPSTSSPHPASPPRDPLQGS